jgi:hypothetical protein
MSQDEVNWSHLPHSPELFFGCAEDATRRDLKRAYNRILKKFKPEQYPEEFKKIRQAFEDLDAQISYGVNFKAPAPEINFEDKTEAPAKELNIEFDDLFDGQTEVQQSSDDKENPFLDDPFLEDPFGDSDTEFDDLFDGDTELQQNPFDNKEAETSRKELAELFTDGASPEDLIKSINSKNHPSSSELILSALISETLDSNFSLLDTLLSSYKAEPDNGYYKNFIFHYLRSKHQVDNVLTSLEKIASIVKGDEFYYFTEPLWYKLADETTLENCCTKLNELEEIIGYIPPSSLSVFYLHFCTRYVFELDLHFVTDKFEFIEECSDNFSWSEECEVQFLNQLLDYRRSLDTFLNTCPIRKQLHHIIKVWCSSNEADKQQTFINEIISMDTGNLYKQLEFNDSDLEPCADVISAICSEVKEDQYEDDLYDDEEKNKKIRSFMLKIEEVTDNSTLGTITTFTFLLLLSLHLVFIIVPATFTYNYIWSFLSEDMVKSWFRYLIYLGVVLALGVPYYIFAFLPVHNKFEKITNVLSRRLYKKVWRQEVVQFLKQHPIKFYDLRMELIYMENTTGVSNNDELGNNLDQDHALRLFSSIHNLQL